MEALFFTGLGVWAAGALLDLILGARRLAGRAAPYVAGALGGAFIAASGVLATLRPAETINLGSTLEVGKTLLALDSLAGIFLTLMGCLAVVVSACMFSWTRPAERVARRGTAAGYLLLLGSVAVVVSAGDAFTFLFAWESLTLSFYLLIGTARRSVPASRAAWVTFAVGKAGGAALLVAFLLLAGRAGSFTIAAWAGVPPGASHTAAYVLLVVGFGAKVGIAPFQVWIPVGYPQAPGPARAALAGLAVNVGFY
ncbi:MAG TPA: proton-conducting transporter membrane subunit, partial [Acidimicrobiales bacterium]|nr:proton-conducting transporter membrane subunit [Acidimicrobiales bacterium]